jgi:hypothetical protein
MRCATGRECHRKASHPAVAPLLDRCEHPTRGFGARRRNNLTIAQEMAGVTGLEPAASGVTGQRSNRLSYTPTGKRGEEVITPHDPVNPQPSGAGLAVGRSTAYACAARA